MNASAPAIVGPFAGYYQVAYVTTDLDRAMALFGETHGLKRWFEMRDIRYPTGPQREAHCDIGLAYLGSTEFEIIQPLDGDVKIYQDFLPDTAGFALRFHHISRMYDSEADLEAQVAKYRGQGKPFPIEGRVPGNSRYYYCDFRAELGHYLEGIWFEPDARGWMDQIPRN